MSQKRIVGMVMLIIGVIVFAIGMSASHSVADRVSNAFTGRFTGETAWYLIGGGAVALFGLLLLVSEIRGRRA